MPDMYKLLRDQNARTEAAKKPDTGLYQLEPTPKPLEPGKFEKAVLLALQGSNVYAGSVLIEEVERRRKKNRHARRARRGNTAAIARQARLNYAQKRRRRFARGNAYNPLKTES